ncbi:sensor histidine kinase [Andreesenia angusta]|uniref:sensor histidine kinase n=1 Tax=Andreesenia angusta TaxID=39480 RepID=UPI00115FC50F|nr:HAMP domain-containing sensor histidine kinase [Andreesenia angusta]
MYLTCFVMFITAILWVVQTVFLDEFYERIKVKSVLETAEYVESEFESENLEAIVDEVSLQEEVSVSIVGQDGSLFIRSDRSHDSVLEKLSSEEIGKIYMQAVESEEGVLKSYQFLKPEPLGVREEAPQKGEVKSIVYANVVEDSSGQKQMLFVDSVITPIDTTVSTLRTQLLYVTGMLVVAAAGLAILLSKKIADPLMRINDAAKTIVDAGQDVRFEGSGYREVVELGDTLNSAVEELSKAEKLQRELVANISHDLKTPLTMIIGYSEAMRDLPGENTPENMQVVIDEANRLNRLVTDVLSISKIQSGTESLELTRVNLTELIERTIDRCSKLTESKGYSIEFLAEEDAWVYADELKISQVIYNLLGNAITHTGEDNRIKVVQSISKDKVKVSVVDSGEGIPKDQLGNIWERYYKLDKVHKRARIGTGLGLSIVKSVVEMHGGSCGVDSEEGKGSEFWFELGGGKLE